MSLQGLTSFGNLSSWAGLFQNNNIIQMGGPNYFYQAAKQSLELLWRVETPAPTKSLIGYLGIADNCNVQEVTPTTAHSYDTHSPFPLSPRLPSALFIVVALCATFSIFSGLWLLRSKALAAHIDYSPETDLDTPDTESPLQYTPVEEEGKAIGVPPTLGTHDSICDITNDLMLANESLDEPSESSFTSEALTFDSYLETTSRQYAQQWNSIRIQYWVDTDVVAALQSFQQREEAVRAKAEEAERRRLEIDAMVAGVTAYAERLGMEASR